MKCHVLLVDDEPNVLERERIFLYDHVNTDYDEFIQGLHRTLDEKGNEDAGSKRVEI